MRSASLVCIAAFAVPLTAQYSSDFESLTASPSGTIITGQDGYYIPVAGSLDGLVVTYTGNTLGVPANPTGGDNFYAGISQATNVFARAQRSIGLSENPIVRVEFDVCCNYLAAGTPANNIGSFSFQPSTNAVYVNLLPRWPTGATAPPPTWDADVVVGTGLGTTVTTVLPDPAFQNLATNVWHRWGVTIDLASGNHVDFRITNGVTNVTTVYVPPTPLPLPVSGGAILPTDFRFFTGGSDNLFAADNISITYPTAAKYTGDFEYFNATPTGTVITGQDGFYIPVAGSLDGRVFTYAGNSLGIPVNPNGGDDFYAGISQATNIFARAQRDMALPGSGIVYVQYDVCCKYVGAGTPTNNIGSFSFQPSGTSVHVNTLARWPAVATVPPTWDADIVVGTVQQNVGDPAFLGLDVDVWHTWGVTADLTTGVYVDFRITNGTTNVTTVFTPPTPLALPNAGLAMPTGFRLFTGGSDNVFAVDNLLITYGAGYTTFGTGCTGTLGVPTLGALGGAVPELGSTFQVELGNLPNGMGIIASGFSNTITSSSTPLPFDLTGNGFPGCFLLVDPLIAEFVSGAGNSATWTFAVPASGIFAGTTYYQQGLSFDVAAPGGAAFSNAGRLQIGY